MGDNDKKKSGHIDTYVGNNYGFGGNKFDGKFNVNLTDGLNMPSASTPAPPTLPQPPSNTDIDTYVGNNYGFGGNKFDGTYDINIGGGQKETPKVKPDPNPKEKPDPNPKEKPDPNPKKKPDPKPKKKPDPKTKPNKRDVCPQPCPQPCHTTGRSTYNSPGGGMQTSCPVCEGIWARNNSMSNYQALLRGDHIYN